MISAGLGHNVSSSRARAPGLYWLAVSRGWVLDLERLRSNVLTRWDLIVDFDNKKHRDEALEKLEKELTQNSGSI